MFRDETALILGAGASKPYGYPLGRELIDGIIKNINKDAIYLPYQTRIPFKQNDLYMFEHSLREFNEISASLFDHKISDGNTSRQMHYSTGHFQVTPIKIDQLDIFNSLKNKLIEIAPVSIDAFLRDNPSYAVAGKTMIIYTLLKIELKSRFQLSQSNIDNWLSHFIDDITNGIIPEDLLENKLSIINFNYDVTLEYCLYFKLLSHERFQANGIAEQFLKNLPIYHVYGQVYHPKFGS